MEGNKSLAQFYSGKSVFITGATGLVGTSLVERLLYSFDDIGNIYMIVRPKKGLSPKERLQQFTETLAFERIRNEKPVVLQKLVAVEGDVTLPNLGLTDESRRRIQSEVSVVFHSSADVRFNVPMRDVINTNLGGTSRVIDLCKEMTKLQSFIHVSTAFSNCELSEIDEMVYPMEDDPHKVLAMLSVDDPTYWEDLTTRASAYKTNPYIYSKALTEVLVEEMRDVLPVSIVRPSVVCGAMKDPEPGWTNSRNGIYGISDPLGRGIVRVAYVKCNVLLETIPVDIVSNFLMAAAWHKAVGKHECFVYNCVSCNTNPATWGDFSYWTWNIQFKIAPFRFLWYSATIFVSSEASYKVGDYLLHYLPAAAIDWILAKRGKKPMLLKYYGRVSGMLDMLRFFMSKDWTWKDHNRKVLDAAMSCEDQDAFPIHVGGKDLVEYHENCSIYYMTRILKWKQQYFEENAKRNRMLYRLHYAAMFALFALFLWLALPYLERLTAF